MYTLYYSPGSGPLIVHALLEEFGVPFEVKKVDAASKPYWSGDSLTAADFHFMVIARPTVARAMQREGIKAFGTV